MKKRAFTLAELLVVLAIMSILSAILLPALRKARERALITKCVSVIASLQVALDMYQMDYGVYPASADIGGANNQKNGNSGAPDVNLVTALTATSLGGPYMEFKAKDLDTKTKGASDSNPVLVDPWGQAYIYTSRRIANGNLVTENNRGPWHPNTNNDWNEGKNTYNIYSLGPDRKTYGPADYGASWDTLTLYDDEEDGHWQNTDVKTDPEYDDINSWAGRRER